VLRELSRETASLYPQQAHMQVDPAQGSLLTVLARAVKAQLAIEVGTFTGYSSICIARGLPPGGKLICCDISEEWTSVARKYWEKAGLDDRIDLRLGPALGTIGSFPAEPIFDLAFIDADKNGYPAYWLELVPRMRPGGLLLADNAFWGGEVVGSASTGRVMYVREFNDLAAADPRTDLALTPIADGLLMACPKAAGQAADGPSTSLAPQVEGAGLGVAGGGVQAGAVVLRRAVVGVDAGDAGEVEGAGVVGKRFGAPEVDQDGVVDELSCRRGAVGGAVVDLLGSGGERGGRAPADPVQVSQHLVSVGAGQDEVRGAGLLLVQAVDHDRLLAEDRLGEGRVAGAGGRRGRRPGGGDNAEHNGN
jgi:caffeoyl-CoA O-methyltransferase